MEHLPEGCRITPARCRPQPSEPSRRGSRATTLRTKKSCLGWLGRNPSGKPGDWHRSGCLSPSNLPITDDGFPPPLSVRREPEPDRKAQPREGPEHPDKLAPCSLPLRCSDHRLVWQGATELSSGPRDDTKYVLWLMGHFLCRSRASPHHESHLGEASYCAKTNDPQRAKPPQVLIVRPSEHSRASA